MTIKKVPPPPPIAGMSPQFNRWLLELTAFINDNGTIDGGNVSGFTTLQSEVTTLNGEVTTLNSEVATNTANIATNTANISTNTTNIAANAAAITALQALPQVRNGAGAPAAGLGNNNDWYADTTNKHIYVKLAGAWTQIV